MRNTALQIKGVYSLITERQNNAHAHGRSHGLLHYSPQRGSVDRKLLYRKDCELRLDVMISIHSDSRITVQSGLLAHPLWNH